MTRIDPRLAAAQSPVLRASSATMVRTIELYKAKLPRGWSTAKLCKATWAEALRMAREEREG